MKKIIVLVFFLIFRLFPAVPSVFADEGQNPDKNIKVRGWETISGKLGLIDFVHDTEPQAPQLSTLIEGEALPAITSLRQVYEWDWANNRRDGLYPRPADAPADYSSLVGFAASGKAILVPVSGYGIGGGFEVLVLYADADSITLQYTLDDSVAGPGYTVHLINFQVDPRLVAFYNELDQAGRNPLPALQAGAIIGRGTGELLVSIRDTGMFMDPRWRYDWWQRQKPASGIELVLGKSNALPAGPGTPPGGLECQPKAKEQYGSSRPYPCLACFPASSVGTNCGTSLEVGETVIFQKKDGRPCPAEGKSEAGFFVDQAWGGTIAVDASKTELPIAGISFETAAKIFPELAKPGKEKELKQAIQEEYLADYFEGTIYYDKKDPARELPDLEYTNPDDVKKAFAIQQQIMDEAGVFRRLAPEIIQDNLKRDMIRDMVRRKANGQPVYSVQLEGEGDPVKLNLFAEGPDRIKPQCQNFKSAAECQDKINEWQKTKWGKLWKAIPMFSRDDLLGGFYLVPQNNPFYPNATIKPADNKAGKLRFPHLARLEEITGQLKSLLVPKYKENPIGLTGKSAAETSGFFGNLRTFSPDFSQKATTQATGGIPYGCKYLYADQWGDCSCMAKGNCRGEHGCCPPHWFWGICGWEECDMALRCPSGNPGYACPGEYFGGPPPTPPPPPCGAPELPEIKACDKMAMGGQGDELCGEAANNFTLVVNDTVRNSEHLSCGVTQNPGTPGWYDPCFDPVRAPVSRKVEVKVSIPLIDKIWQQTAGGADGLFKIFKITNDKNKDFDQIISEDMPAETPITYSFSGAFGGEEPYIKPQSGTLKISHLGALKQLKDLITGQILMPQ